MTTEKKTQNVDLDAEFMDSLAKEPLTAEKAQKMKKSLEASIENSQKTVTDLKDLHDASQSKALKILKSKVETTLHASVNEGDIKAIGDGKKQLESVLLVLDLIHNLCFQYENAKSDIERYKAQIEEIKIRCRQMKLPFDEKEKAAV